MAKLAVFCSSSEQVSPIYLSQAADFGRGLARAGHSIIYGGANCGMMGELARAALKEKGEVIGVVPDLDFLKGLNQSGLSQQMVVRDLAERKGKMLSMADGAVALPGGLGTLDEIFEALVLKMAGEWNKPFWFFDFMGYWQPVVEALSIMAEQKMITAKLDELFFVTEKQDEIFQRLGK